jgi:hypothetical protein
MNDHIGVRLRPILAAPIALHYVLIGLSEVPTHRARFQKIHSPQVPCAFAAVARAEYCLIYLSRCEVACAQKLGKPELQGARQWHLNSLCARCFIQQRKIGLKRREQFFSAILFDRWVGHFEFWLSGIEVDAPLDALTGVGLR